MRFRRILIASLAALLLTATPAAAASIATPFKSDATLQASLAPTSVPNVFTGMLTGAGHASHLGRVTLSLTETLDFASSPGIIVVRDGRMVMVAANGDELHWTYEGTGSLPDAEGNTVINGSFVITGGTGRFTDATGTGTIQGSVDTFTGVVSVTYLGTITY
jgi:hypothetical protein